MTGAALDVLEANGAFYRAFAGRDLAAMARTWAERHAVLCIHPGWDVLEGRERVLASWRAILESENAPAVACERAEAHLLGEVALVTCHELVAGGRLAATNVFVLEDGRWRMVHHQATAIAPGQVRPMPRGPAA